MSSACATVPVLDDDALERFGELVGHAPPMQTLFERLRRAAQSDSTVLIEGESGCGKGRVAREIHLHSARSGRPFVMLCCDRGSHAEFEEELFGERRGAFSDADGAVGALARAQGGTLFLDAVNELPLALQARLLRVVEARRAQKLGSNSWRRYDVRIIASSHQPLAERCRAGVFRPDLYYRLAVLPVQVPPLRERLEDLAHLVGSILAEEGVLEPVPIDWRELHAHKWQGNVRELRNVVRRLVLGVEGSHRRRLLREERSPPNGGRDPSRVRGVRGGG